MFGHSDIESFTSDSFGVAQMFKIGDVVTLKSGSPKMTVTNARNRNGVPHVWTSWINKDGKEEHSFYHADAVMLPYEQNRPS